MDETETDTPLEKIPPEEGMLVPFGLVPTGVWGILLINGAGDIVALPQSDAGVKFVKSDEGEDGFYLGNA